MTIHVLVEGPSERVLLERWMPRLLKTGEIRVHPHQGKGSLPADLTAMPDRKRRGLLDQLPATLRGLAGVSHGRTNQVVVLVDADSDDVADLASSLSEAAAQVAPELPVSVQLAVEETEAFYLGDLRGLQRAFPDAVMDRARAYEPDSIVGTWEVFGDVVGDRGGNKVAWAEAMGPVLTTKPAESRSPSFKRFVVALLALLPGKPEHRGKRRYRHIARKARKAGRAR